MKRFGFAVAALMSLLFGTGTSGAQSALPDRFFPFYIPWNDATPGTATDLSAMNVKPAGKNGRIVVIDGHLAEAGTKKRVRFFATNIAADEAFPAHKSDADEYAAALAKRGINLVRLHHLDNPWAIKNGGSIWSPNDPRRQVPDPVQLDKLDYLVAQLIKNGIYVNINLKVSKELSEADGLPASVGSITFPHQKRVDYFNPRMIELQKDYAKRLLTHVNPYLGKSYVDEPGVAIVEINNENCLMTVWPGQKFGYELDTLGEPFRSDLQKKWNDWLAARGDDAALIKRWNAGLDPLGASVIPPAKSWVKEQQGEAAVEINPAPAVEAETMPLVSIKVPKIEGPDWHGQVQVLGLNLREGAQYTLTFDARSPKPRKTAVSLGLDVAPWSNVGLAESVATDDEWKTFTFPFVARGVKADHVRISFAVGGTDLPLEIRGLQLRAGSPGVDLAGGSLADRSVPLPFKASPAQYRDFVDFLVSIELVYANEMREYLRKDLGVKSLVLVSQVQWGGLAGLLREAGSDIVDTHEYSEHPQFPEGASWSPSRWSIAQKSQVKGLGESGRLTLSGAAEYRVSGRPFSVSEYDQAAPNDFAAECLPLLAGVGATQDWDAIYTFAQGPYGKSKKIDRIIGFFDHTNHPAKVALYPFAATLFRSADAAPISARARLAVGSDSYHTVPNASDAWRRAAGGSAVPDILSRRLELSVQDGHLAAPTLVLETSDSPSPLAFTSNPLGGILTINYPQAVGVVGFVGGTTARAGPLDVLVAEFGNNFGVITAHSVDQKPIGESARVLLTVIGRAENVGMNWNADRTSVGDKWGTGPVHCEGLAANISIERKRSATVYALDPNGKRKQSVPAEFAGGRLKFAVSASLKTVWYEVAE